MGRASADHRYKRGTRGIRLHRPFRTFARRWVSMCLFQRYHTEKWIVEHQRRHGVRTCRPAARQLGHPGDRQISGRISVLHDSRPANRKHGAEISTVSPGGITARLLYGDLSAASGFRALARDQNQARDFLAQASAAANEGDSLASRREPRPASGAFSRPRDSRIGMA